MTTLNNDLTLMDTIINIQAMRACISKHYDKSNDLSRLQTMKATELIAEQDRLIPIYNQIIRQQT